MSWKCEECGNVNPDLMAHCVKCSGKRKNYDIDIQASTSSEEDNKGE